MKRNITVKILALAFILTGAPFGPSDDDVDENGKFVGFISLKLCVQNILEGVVKNQWMLLEIK